MRKNTLDYQTKSQVIARYYRDNLREITFWAFEVKKVPNIIGVILGKSDFFGILCVKSQKSPKSARYYRRNLREKLLFWNFVCKNTLDYQTKKVKKMLNIVGSI